MIDRLKNLVKVVEDLWGIIPGILWNLYQGILGMAKALKSGDIQGFANALISFVAVAETFVSQIATAITDLLNVIRKE